MFNRLILLASLLSLIVLTVVLNLTSPTGVGPLGVLVFFVALYIIFYGMIMGLMRLFKKVSGKTQGLIRKEYYIGVVLAFGPIMILLMRSFGTLSIFTVIMVGLFMLLSSFLMSKRL